ncbi:MAG: pyridoxal-phosphate dependent enzyme, partial [Candidatus Promineifilaceae bacterium]|nr:pyridoxal-phosphate dependent enzyme [Candidatus Promineifilaceae bacterium]
MNHVISLKSLISGREFAQDEVDYVDPEFGNDGILDVQYDYDYISSRFSREKLQESKDYTIWRYKPLLPVELDAEVPPLAVGWTPMYDAPRMARHLGLRQVWVKDDGRNPTASFKDRASAIAVVKA